MKLFLFKLSVLSLSLFSTLNAYGAIDYSQYDDGPDFFFGWETSIYCAIATFVLFGISWIISKCFEDKNGQVKGPLGCILCCVNIAAIICGLGAIYILIPLGIIHALLAKK